MKNSPNYQLALIEDSDAFSAESLNQNFTLIDSLLKRLMPSGVIVSWYGTETNCPEGWAICDGTNGTPDLRGRFIVAPEKFVGDTIVMTPSKYSGNWSVASIEVEPISKLTNVSIKYSYSNVPSGDTIRINTRTSCPVNNLSGTKAETTVSLGTVMPWSMIDADTDNVGPTLKYTRGGTGSLANTSITLKITVNGTTITSANFGSYFRIKYTYSDFEDGVYEWTSASASALIKAGDTGGEKTHKLVTSELPVHTHNQNLMVSGETTPLPYANQNGNGSAYSTTAITANTTGSKSSSGTTRKAVTTNSAGSSVAHNNMPPYYALYYIMKL